MNKTKYYLRIRPTDRTEFDAYIIRNNIEANHYSSDVFADAALYELRMSKEDELAIKLSFPLVGCMDFNKVLDKRVSQPSTRSE